MKFKLPAPEDFTDEKDYSVKLSKAYANTHIGLLTLINAIDILLEMHNEKEIDEEYLVDRLGKQIQKFRI